MNIYTITTQEILERISRHCPEALSTYFQCINRANDEGEVFFPMSTIDIDMSESLTKFRNNIKKLAKENLLEWHLINKGILVKLAKDVNDE